MYSYMYTMYVVCMHASNYYVVYLYSYGMDVSVCCLESIESLAEHYGTTSSLHSVASFTQSLQHFLQVGRVDTVIFLASQLLSYTIQC